MAQRLLRRRGAMCRRGLVPELRSGTAPRIVGGLPRQRSTAPAVGLRGTYAPEVTGSVVREVGARQQLRRGRSLSCASSSRVLVDRGSRSVPCFGSSR